MNTAKLWIIAILFTATFASFAHAEQTWTVFTGNFPEGTPPIVNVISSDEDSTVVEITTPGRRGAGAERRVRVEFIPRIGTFL